MKKILSASVLFPVAVLMAGCSSDPAPQPRLEGDFDVMLTMHVDGLGSRAVTDVPAGEDELDNARLFFATYKNNLALLHPLYEAGTANSGVNAIFFLPNWGPSVAAKLPKEDYRNGFYTVAFSIPENMNPEKKVGELSDVSFTTLSWPAPGKVWVPGSEGNNIPMAGINRITGTYMEQQYKDPMFGHNPMRLPDIEMTRAMAKIVIEDPDNIIAEVTLKTPDKGSLIPEQTSWADASVADRPVTVKGASFFNQTLSSPNGPAGEVKQYILYSFEHSFYNAAGTAVEAAGSSARSLITLKSSNSALGTKTLSIAPYAGGSVDSGKNLITSDGGVWRGLMRNTVYTFRIRKPASGGVQVEVKPGKWISHKEEFSF